MQITITLDTCDAADLAGLAALVASLGGHAPQATVKPPVTARAAPPPPSEPSANHDDTTRMTASDEGAPDADGSPFRLAESGDVDAEGLPWDERIHSSPPKRNKDDTWRTRRGVDEVTYGKVHAELTEAAGRPNERTGTSSTGTEQPDGDSANAETDRPLEPGAGQATITRTVPPPPSEPEVARTAPPPPPADDAPAVTGGFEGFPDFVQKVNKFGHPYVKLNEIAGNVGIAGGFKDMKDHPGLWEMFYAMAQG